MVKLVQKEMILLINFAEDAGMTMAEISLITKPKITISFLDNSSLTFESNSEFIIEKFDSISPEPVFILSVKKGKFIFESGLIAKNKKGIMTINLSDVAVNLEGTLVSGYIEGAEKNISLLEDSIGNVGSLNLTVGDKTTAISDASTGINISGENDLTNTLLSEQETNETKTFIKNITVESSTETEEQIERAVTKQLAKGTIPDANGDGILDSNDIEAYKTELFNLKGTKLKYLMEQSNNDVSLMSAIIKNSDANQSMGLMQGMMNNNEGSAAMLINEVSKDGFDVFGHMNSASTGAGKMSYSDFGNSQESFDDLRKNIVSGIMQDQSEFAVKTN